MNVPSLVLSVGAAGATVLLLASCGGESDPASATPDATPSPSPTSTSTSTSASPSPSEPEDSGSPLDGTWTVGPMTMSDTSAHLEENGLGKWEKPFMKLDGITGPGTELTYTVEMADGMISLSAEVGDDPIAQYDQASYTVEGDRFTIVAANGCSGSFGWEQQGEEVHLTLLEDDCPPVGGIPDEVFMRAYYEVQPLVPSA